MVTIYLASRCGTGARGSRDDVAAVVLQPTRGRAGRSWSLYLALLQVGFDRRCVATAGRALLPPDFTLTPRYKDAHGAVCFCATFRLPRRTDPLRKPGRYPAPCPEEPGLSSPAAADGDQGGHPVRTPSVFQSSTGTPRGQTDSEIRVEGRRLPDEIRCSSPAQTPCTAPYILAMIRNGRNR